MTEISNPEEWPLELYPEVESPTEDVLSHYAIVVENDGGYIVHHTISWSMWFLTADEYEHVLENEIFKKYKIVLDKSIDEDEIAEKVYLKRSEISTPFTYDKIKDYIIFTTSACNARCPYCYENGIAKLTMTEKTAEDVFQFIKRTNNGNVRIRWFGGEPLLNTKVIDYICRRMDEEGLYYETTMITNGYFLEEYCDSFEKWHLHDIQVTFDHINDRYNDIKQYVVKDESPFDKVISGIKKVYHNSNCAIKIRINVSDDNIDDFNEIVVYLKEILQEELPSGRIKIYSSLIYEILCDEIGEKPEEYRKRLNDVMLQHKDIFPNAGEIKPIKKSTLYLCSSVLGRSVVINPIGKLSPCEHWKDEDIVGDVISGITNTDKAEEWRLKGGKNVEFCKKMRCPILPSCNHFYKCDGNPYCKTKRKFEIAIDNTKKAIIATWEYYKQHANDVIYLT